MRHVIDTGTDVATVCFFDPAALPENFDQRVRIEMPVLFEELAKQGRLWWQRTGSDGAYLFHFYVNERPPAEILAHSQDPRTVERFLVPSGKIFACGAENAAKKLIPGAGHSPLPRESLDLPQGEYSVTAWRGEWPEDYYDGRMTKALGEDEWRRQQRLGLAGGYVCIFLLLAGLFILIATISKSGRSYFGVKGLICLWIGWIILLQVVPRVMSHFFPAASTDVAREVKSNMPGIVVYMEQNTASQ